MATQAQLDALTAQTEALNKKADSLNGDLDAFGAKLEAFKKRQAAEAAVTDKSYTLFASGFRNGGRDVDLKSKNTSTDLAILFDVVENHSYSRNVNKTQFATEDKVSFSDHAVIEDGKFSFTARVNSSPVYLIQNNYIDKDTNKDNPLSSKRPQKALDVLLEIIDDRQIVTLITEDIILENYILTSMTAARSTEEGDSLEFQLEFTEFRTFTLGKTVLASNFSDAKKSGNKQKGAVNSSADEKRRDTYSTQSKLVTESGKKAAGWVGMTDKTSAVMKDGTWNPDTGQAYDLNDNPIAR